MHESAQIDTELLLAFSLACNRTYLFTWPEKIISPEQQQQFETLISLRLIGTPIAYLLGYKEFWSLQLAVSSDTLIPRPETELLVKQALHKIPPQANWTIADLGTGSGAIALAIASERPHCNLLASDVSSVALNIAQQNATQLDIHNITFSCGHWFDPHQTKKFNLIVSNPPYIAQSDEHLNQGDVAFEPPSALVSGSQGLDDINIIISQAKNYLLKNGLLMLEHGFEQHRNVQRLLTENGYADILTIEDLHGLPRVTIGELGTGGL